MQSRTMVVVVALVAVVGVTGASAFTTATVARDAQIDVASDQNSVIELDSGTVDGAEVTGDTLVINGESAGEPGINTEANFTFGNTSNPSNTHAFTIRNADDVSHDFEFSFSGTTAVTVLVYDNSGNELYDSSANSNTAATIASGDTAYAVVEVDTSGTSSGDTISGTLEISAS